MKMWSPAHFRVYAFSVDQKYILIHVGSYYMEETEETLDICNISSKQAPIHPSHYPTVSDKSQTNWGVLNDCLFDAMQHFWKVRDQYLHLVKVNLQHSLADAGGTAFSHMYL